MNVILYMATSINGLITSGQDDSDWVSETDWAEFDALMKNCGIMVMGRKTYEIFGEDFTCEGAVNVVMTSNKKLTEGNNQDDVVFTNKSPKDVLEMAKDMGFENIMLIGGEKLNTSFIKENLVDEVWISVHPVLIGSGLGLMGELEYFHNLKRTNVKELENGLLQIRYRFEAKK